MAVLPASALLPKRTAPSPTRTGAFRWAGRPLAPPGEARQDWWIIQEIANRMGQSWNYGHARDIFGEMRLVMPSRTWHFLGPA